MGNLLLIIAVIVILAASVIFAILRGLARARIRGICVVVSGILAFCATLLFKSKIISPEFMDMVLPWLENQNYEQIKSFLDISPTLNDLALKCASSLIAPLLTLVFFLLFMLVTWIIYLAVMLIWGDWFKKQNEKALFRLPRTLVWGAVQGIVIVIVLLLPISAYLDLAPKVMDAVLETDVMEEGTENTVQTIMDETVSPMNEGALMAVYRTLGGKGLTCMVTDFKIAGERTHLNEEIDSVAAFACNVARLTQIEFTKYGSDEAVVIVAIADSFENSVLLPIIAGEVIYGVSDAWIADKDFLGMARPAPEGDMGEVADEFLLSLLRILHADAHDYPALQSDIRTVAEMVASMAEHEIFAKMSNSTELLRALSQSGVIKELIVTVGENDSMKILVPQITNMGVKTVVVSLKIPADKGVVYQDLLKDFLDSIGYVNRTVSNKTRIRLLSTYLNDTFDNSNLSVPKELADAIAIALDRDLMRASKEGTLTVDGIADFFRIYAAELDGKKLTDVSLETPIYASMNQEQLESCGAVALARALKAISLLPEGEAFNPSVTASLLEAFGLSETAASEYASILKMITLQGPLTDETPEALASLANVESFKTDLVTLEELLVDSDSAAEKLNSETIKTEAEAINSVFASIEGLLDRKEGEDYEIFELAEIVGEVLDSLKTGEVYGKEMTAKLFTAILQSNTVRDKAKLSLSTATEMAKKSTEGDVNYTETFLSIARSVTILTELGENGKKADEEDLVKLVEGLNPQSAGMLEVYVTADRIEEYGVSSKYSGTSADLLSSTFGYMADNELEDAEAEAKALNQVLDIAISANSHSSGKQLFSDSEREGILPSATETVETIMASQSVTHSLRENLLDEEGNVIEEKQDSFDLGRKLEEGSAEYNEFVEALDASYQADPSEENKQTLTALAALFGITY